jgi:hypothetical protein
MSNSTRNLGPGRTQDARIDTTPVRQLVHDVLVSSFGAPYAAEIIDQVCLAIEADPQWQRRYDELVADFIRRNPRSGRDIANNSIGYWTKKETDMQTVKKGVPAKSRLIKSYSRLGYE